MYLLYFGDIPNLVSCAFSTIPIFPPFNSLNFSFTCLCSFCTCFAVLEESRSFAPPQKWLISMVTWGIKCARGRGRRRNMQLHNFVYTVGRTCSKKTACLNFLCLLSMVLKTRGLGAGATFMRGSYVAEPRLLSWLREHTVLFKSEHELSTTIVANNSTENI